MPEDTQPPAPEYGSAGESPYGAGPNPYAPRPNPYAAGPNPYAPGPNPYAPEPNPYAAGPNPYAPEPNPYAAGPNPYAPGPNPYAGGPNPYGTGQTPYTFGPGPYGPGYPGQLPPARAGRARIHATWLAVTLLVAVVTGSSAYYLGTHHAQRPAPSRPAAAASQHPLVAPPPANAYQCAPTDTAAGPDSRLISELLPVPAGAARPPAAPGPKAYTLHAYVTYLYAKSAVGHEQALLQARCFQVAVNGQWLTSGGTLVSIWLVQFADSGGARSYALGQEQTDLNLMGSHGRWASVSAVSDGMLIQDPGLDAEGDTFTRIFGDRGNVMILIHVYVPARWASENSMSALLRAQAGRI